MDGAAAAAQPFMLPIPGLIFDLALPLQGLRIKRGPFVNCEDCGNPTRGLVCFKCQEKRKKHRAMNIAAVRVDRVPEKPGEFLFTMRDGVLGPAGLLFCCPCGCGELGALSFDNAQDEHPKWHWDGNDDKPTLTPSLRKTAGCQWHGWLTAGEFRSC